MVTVMLLGLLLAMSLHFIPSIYSCIHILTNEVKHVLITSNDGITGLLRVYSSLVLNPQTNYDISLLYKIFGLLLKESYTQCNLDWCNLYQFFTKVIKSLRLVCVYLSVCVCVLCPCIFIICMEMSLCICVLLPIVGMEV